MKRVEFESEGNVFLDLLFTDEEYDMICEAADSMGMTLSEFARYAFSQTVSRERERGVCCTCGDRILIGDESCPVHGRQEEIDPVRGAFDGY